MLSYLQPLPNLQLRNQAILSLQCSRSVSSSVLKVTRIAVLDGRIHPVGPIQHIDLGYQALALGLVRLFHDTRTTPSPLNPCMKTASHSNHLPVGDGVGPQCRHPVCRARESCASGKPTVWAIESRENRTRSDGHRKEVGHC